LEIAVGRFERIIELRGDVTSGDDVVRGVRARITLPESPFAKPRLTLFPESRAEVDRIVRNVSGSFEGIRAKGFDGGGEERVVVRDVYFRRGNTRRVSHDIERSIVSCHVGSVCHFVADDPSQNLTPCRIVFRVYPNQQLRGLSTEELSYTGDIRTQRHNRVCLQLKEGFAVSADRHFVWHHEKRGALTTRMPFDVLEADVEVNAHDSATVERELLPLVDDALILSSLASTQRTICVGWSVSTSNTATITRFYRGGISRPRRRESDALDWGLIPRGRFREFFSRAWPAFQSSDYREAVAACVYARNPIDRRTLEARYLGLFSALEEVVLAFRRTAKLEFVIDDAAFRRIRTRVENSVKTELPNDEDRPRRKLLYDGIQGLNRVPLRFAFEQFVQQFRVDLHDLWPVFAEPGLGLSSIRNKIVHGDLGKVVGIGPLAVALDHLQWTVERIVLTLLDWPVDESEVSRAFLAKGVTSWTRLKRAREELERALRGKEA
jgi:hypothetical protein